MTISYKEYTVNGVTVHVVKDKIEHLKLIQVSNKPAYLSQLRYGDKIPNAIINCSYFDMKGGYAIGRNQGDVLQQTSSFADNGHLGFALTEYGYEAGKLNWWDNEQSVCGFSPATISILQGQDVQMFTKEFTPSYASEMSETRCETVFAINDDKTIAYFITAEKGISGYDLLDWIKKHGSWSFVCNLDNGGSTEMIIGGDIVQQSLDEGVKERLMFNGLAFVDDEEQPMFLNRLSKTGTEEWDQSMISSGLRLPNCSAYCMLEYWEQGGKKIPLFNARTWKGFPEAKNWYADYLKEKGIEPRVGGFLVWGSATAKYGHVAYCYDVKELGNGKWKVKVSQSNYEGVYFETKEYEVEKGVVTKGVGFPYIGCCYTQINDKRVERDETRHQVEIVADMLSARRLPNGDKIKGLYIPQGIYDILEVEDDGTFLWVKLAEDVWCATNDEWAKIYEPGFDSFDYAAEYEILKGEYALVVNQLQHLQTSLDEAKKSLDDEIEKTKKLEAKMVGIREYLSLAQDLTK